MNMAAAATPHRALDRSANIQAVYYTEARCKQVLRKVGPLPHGSDALRSPLLTMQPGRLSPNRAARPALNRRAYRAASEPSMGSSETIRTVLPSCRRWACWSGAGWPNRGVVAEKVQRKSTNTSPLRYIMPKPLGPVLQRVSPHRAHTAGRPSGERFASVHTCLIGGER